MQHTQAAPPADDDDAGINDSLDKNALHGLKEGAETGTGKVNVAKLETIQVYRKLIQMAREEHQEIKAKEYELQLSRLLGFSGIRTNVHVAQSGGRRN
jgi:hypothetical protein